jgi:hypothetical protein
MLKKISPVPDSILALFTQQVQRSIGSVIAAVDSWAAGTLDNEVRVDGKH